MLIIGLTGSFGTGKTYVASIFRSLGADVIDADKIAHSALERGSRTYQKIVKHFGSSVLKPGGRIDRRRLSGVVFTKPGELRKLNEIIHPEVIRKIFDKVKRARQGDVVVIDAPLLVETKLLKLIDVLVVVKTSRKNQFARCLRKFNITAKECLARTDAQVPLKKKIELADYVIDNDGARRDTAKQVRQIWRKIWK